MNVRLTQIDGAMPNLALMKLAHWHRAEGDTVHVTRSIDRDLFEPEYDRVYGSAIFKFSAARILRFVTQWPGAIIGGTGTHETRTVEDVIGAGLDEYEHYSYDGWDVDYSIGFSQRGCRLKCHFCVVRKKEGKNRAVNRIESIWRGTGHPKKVHLLDNDFFGQPDWEDRAAEIINGGFRVCMSQGINVRLIKPDGAQALARMEYRDTNFRRKRLYTAWDNLGDEAVFFNGVEILERAGVPAKHLMAYMLVGYDKKETWPRIWHRFNRMVAAGIRPYPMVYDRARKDLLDFQRWVVTGLYRAKTFAEYLAFVGRPDSVQEAA